MAKTAPLKKSKNDISCKAAAKLLSESFEHELPLAKKIALQTHLALCKTCVFCYRQLKGLRAIFSKYDQAVTQLPPPSCCCLSEDSKKRMKDSIVRKSSSNSAA